MGFAVYANACDSVSVNARDYRARFLQECAWLAAQQQSAGGIQEGEDYTSVVESDNTQEAIWIWSRYAELTGDYTTYQTRINKAWTYCLANPAWLEGGARATPLNYYSTYNIGWGLLAEMKYRQVYSGKSGYVNHTSYAASCADTLVNYTPGTSNTTDALCLGIASGALYQYGVDVNSSTYKNRAVVLGGNIRTWLNGNTANFAAESWAVSGGIAVWGVLNSYYKDTAYAGGAAAWAETANTYMPLNAANGANNNYEYGMDGWYAWGHYAVSRYRGADSFAKYKNVIDKIMASDNDADGGIRQGITYADTSDYAWVTNIAQFAVNYGLIGTTNYTISGTITSDGSPLAGVKMSGLPGDPCTDASGNYTTAYVPAGFYGTVTPSKVGYSFMPATITYSNVTANQTARNYAASAGTYVSILGSWTTGTTHAKETGTNRALLFVAHAKSSSASNLTAVTYGGRSMTKITDQIIGSGSSLAYVAAFILNDANITAATTTTFTPAWTNAPSSVTYTNVFLKDVNQTTLFGAAVKNGLTGVYSIATASLAANNGDMIIENAASSVTGTYLPAIGWTKDVDLSVSGYDGMDGHKNAAGINETPAITQASANHSLIAYVVKAAPPSTYTLTISTSGSGSVTKNPDRTSYTSGTAVTLTANPAAGLLFSQWSGDVNGASNPTTITMNSNKSVTAIFGIQTFSVTGTAGANGSITATTAVVNYNGSQLFTAAANTGYTVDKWTVDGVDAQAGGTTYTLSSIIATHTVAVSFRILTYSVTASAGANGSINPSGTFNKNYGSSQLFTAAPATGYAVDKWTVDGVDAQAGGTTYTLSNITTTHTVTVSFKIITYTVTGTACANGSITPTGTFNKDYGSSQLFTAAPITGYAVDKWTVDGVDAQAGGTTYTLSNITATHTVVVSFKILTYTVTASADANGSITPTIAVINYNGSQLFTAAPMTGYAVDKWTLDGADIQAGGTTCTLSSITAAHTVAVTFSRIIFSISGYVAEIDGNTPVKDVLMSAGDANALTDANGYYELSVGYGWSGVIAPEKQGYVFEPNSDTYDNVTQSCNDVNYTATLMTFKIAGYMFDSANSSPISNTSVSAENGGGPWTSKYGGGSSLTDASGYYQVLVDYNWSGKITPAKYAYAFEPNSTSYEDVNADYTASQDYTGALLTYKIAGCITNKCNVPIKNVLVIADNAGGQAVTDANGFYEVWVSYAWTGTVTPAKKHFTFTPGNGSYAGVLVDQVGQNYTADNIYDLDCDGYIDLGDVKVMCDNWLTTDSKTTIPGDLDADVTVNLMDFVIFSSVWGD